MGSIDQLLRDARDWQAADPDPETRAELDDLIDRAEGGDAGSLAERFAGRLEFGTAGLRGEMGAGPMRMNRLVVRQAAAGLARFLGPGRTVVVGFDARHHSDGFARESAQVFAAAGLRAIRFDAVCPTPVLAFAVRALSADAGVMCTASHNPARDNGYKVYLVDGAQIIPPVDSEIAAAIDEAATAPVELAAEDDPAIEVVGPELIEQYLDHVVGLVAPGPRDVRIAYTPLHGVGGEVMAEAFRRAGFTDLHVVAAQADPDPDFPTVVFPNPEEPGALDRAAALATEVGADVVIANDPDADRLGIMVPDDDGFRSLSGNEIGALLAERVLATSTGADRLVVTTFVSSHLLARLAEAEGVRYAEVPTGFKWVVRPGLDDPTARFVFGYEEALGYSVDESVRDKDGISAALRFAELVAAERAAGGQAADGLERLARRFGLHATRTWSWRVDGSAGLGQIAAAMTRLRTQPPAGLAGVAVASVQDLLHPQPGSPPTDAVIVGLADGGRVGLRPSGTEPKLKVYAEVVVPVGTRPDAYRTAQLEGDRRVAELIDSVRSLLGQTNPVG